MQVLLVRHGETEWNGARRLQGQHDVSLSTDGRSQVAALRPAVEYLNPEYVVASGLRRAQETSEILGRTDFVVDDRLNEAYLGTWEGQYSDHIRRIHEHEYGEWRAGRFTPPGAETFSALADRVVVGVNDAVTRAVHSGASTVMVVFHGGAIRALLQAVIGLEPDRTVPSHPASLSVLDIDPAAQNLHEPGSAKLRLYNYSPAFSPLDPPD